MNPGGAAYAVAVVSVPILMACLVIILFRLVQGPTTADRVLALDLMTMVAVGILTCLAVQERNTTHLDVAAVIVLVNFMATVAFARYLALPSGRKEQGLHEGHDA